MKTPGIKRTLLLSHVLCSVIQGKVGHTSYPVRMMRLNPLTYMHQKEFSNTDKQNTCPADAKEDFLTSMKDNHDNGTIVNEHPIIKNNNHLPETSQNDVPGLLQLNPLSNIPSEKTLHGFDEPLVDLSKEHTMDVDSKDSQEAISCTNPPTKRTVVDTKTTKQKPSILPMSLLCQVTQYVKDNPNTVACATGNSHTLESNANCFPAFETCKSTENHIIVPSFEDQTWNHIGNEATESYNISVKCTCPTSSRNEVYKRQERGSDSEVDLSSLFSEDFEKSYKRHHRETSQQKKRKRKTAVQTADTKDEKQPKKPKRQPPNHFIAVQITNSDIHNKIKEVQEAIIHEMEELKPTIVALPTLHITLSVMRLENDEDINRAKAALDKCQEELSGKLFNEDFRVEGIGHFNNKVVFALVQAGPGLEQLKEIATKVDTIFRDYNITKSDERGFKPHLTLMKMSKGALKLKRKGVKNIPPHCYKKFTKMHFGVQNFESLQLCAMHKKDINGYYQKEHEVKLDVSTLTFHDKIQPNLIWTFDNPNEKSSEG